MNRYTLPVLIVAALFMWSCTKDDDQSGTFGPLDASLELAMEMASGGVGSNYFKMPQSDNYDQIPQDPQNPITKEKVELGKFLFHETGIALAPAQAISAGTYSCATCHFASAGFQAGRFQGVADGGFGFGQNGEGREIREDYLEEDLDVQPVKSPSAMNGAYQEVMLWNGQFGATGVNEGTSFNWTAETPKEVNFLGYEGLETQAIAAIDVHNLEINNDFLAGAGYMEMFDKAFPNVPEEERYVDETAGQAIAAYERTLLANESPFQKYLSGQLDAMTDQEKRGAILFFDKANCASCHKGPALNDMEFYALGMKDLGDIAEETFKTPADDPSDLGRGSFTQREEDMYKFKVPQLYNLSDSPFYGHGSSFRNIRDVVAYKNEAQPENADVPTAQLAADFVPLDLTEEEIDDITAFLTNALSDPNLQRYEPETLPSGNCFPNNDPISQTQLGCE